MPKRDEADVFKWGERFAYILFAILLFTWAFVSDLEMDLRWFGLGYVDPFFTFGVMWIGVVFIMKAGIAFLQRRSYRAMSDEWKGPLTDIKTDKIIGREGKTGAVAVNELAIFPTGGTSKPSVRGFTGTRFLIFPLFYSVIIGGYVIIMTKLRTYPKGSHGDLLYHIVNTMKKQKGFERNHTRIAVGENPDPKWAVWHNKEWVIGPDIVQGSNIVSEESINRKHNDLIDEGYRTRMELDKYGPLPEEE